MYAENQPKSRQMFLTKYIKYTCVLLVLLLSSSHQVSGKPLDLNLGKYNNTTYLNSTLDKLSFSGDHSAFGKTGPLYQLGALQLTAAYAPLGSASRGGLTYAGGRYYLSSRDTLTAISYHVSIPAEIDPSTQFEANTTGARFSWEHILGHSLKMILDYEAQHRNRDGFTIRSNKLTFQYFF